ncbi:MAG: hypothetical protein WC565_05800 [Parcubacteria group bacterium]|jgi:hypothetical protein
MTAKGPQGTWIHDKRHGPQGEVGPVGREGAPCDEKTRAEIMTILAEAESRETSRDRSVWGFRYPLLYVVAWIGILVIIALTVKG